ncbi:MAG TPA: hypothetical protein VFF28_03365 [Candidatus Nanoarchaeia archaeon]|nr:hypothetical protein [Candidatus Nanoarchaeia archaeon]
MKRLYAIGLFLIVMLAASMSAAVLMDKTSIDITSKPTGPISSTFKLTNNNTASTTASLQLVSSDLSRYNLSLSPNGFNQQFTMSPGQSIDFTLTGRVPKDVTTRTAAYTGTIKAYFGTTELASLPLNVIVESQLSLEDVKFKVDGKSRSIDNGNTRSDVFPGSKLEISGDVENLFSDDDDIQIEDVEVEITIEGIDDDDDLEETIEIGDIDADDTESFTATFDIPENVDEGDYDVRIEVTGDDENGGKHVVLWDDIKIDIEKEKHDIQIRKLSLAPTRVDCNRNIKLDMVLKNLGRTDEDEVVLRIENTALGISEEDTSIPEIEEGTDDETEYEKVYSFRIGDSVRAGTYPISVKAYYETDTLSDTQSVDLTVAECRADEPVKRNDSVVIVNPPRRDEPSEPDVIIEPVDDTEETGILDSSGYMIFLIAAIGVAVLVIIVMIIVLFTVRRKD